MSHHRFALSACLEHMHADPESLADRVLLCLEGMAAFDQKYSNWYRPAASRSEALAHQLVSKGRRTRQSAGWLAEGAHGDVQMVRMCWNGLDGIDSRSFGIRADLPPSAPVMPANLSLSFHDSLEHVRPERDILQAIIELWSRIFPIKWARAYSSETLETFEGSWDENTAGWLTYLRQDPAITVPTGVEVIRPFGGSGVLYVAAIENPSPNDTEAVDRMRALSEALWRSGALPRRSE